MEPKAMEQAHFPTDLHCITAQAFISVMENIWDGNLSRFYDQWHDANKVAKALGLKHTGNSYMPGWLGKVYAKVYRFPDGSGIKIHHDGSAIRPATYRHGAASAPGGSK
jgi:hypothetical protein